MVYLLAFDTGGPACGGDATDDEVRFVWQCVCMVGVYLCMANSLFVVWKKSVGAMCLHISV